MTDKITMVNKIGSYSKEAIRARMLQNAVKIWKLKNIGSIDPFVKLLIDAFSTEIFKISNEMQASNKRIIEKLAGILTPSLYTCPQPAHAVVTTLPIESTEVLPEYTEFFTQRHLSSTFRDVSDDTIKISFTPVDNIRLVNMQVCSVLTNTMCYVFDEFQQKIPFGKISGSLAHNSIMIGVDVSGCLDNIPEKLSLYCSNQAFEDVDFVFKLLPFVKVKCGNKELNVTKGLSYETSEASILSGYEEIFHEYKIQTRIKENIKRIYDSRFIEISGLPQDCIECELPDNLKYDENVSAAIRSDREILWLEVTFPIQFTADIIEGFSFALNAFPVYNRSWKNERTSLDIMGNTIPLLTDKYEHFLYVDKIEDSLGNVYQDIPLMQNSHLGQGLYTVRKGGMERFDERNAIDMMENVLELVRDEVSAFSVYKRDDVTEAVKRMILQMKLLEQETLQADKRIKQEVNYVIINSSESKSNYFEASYWVTHCSTANNIRTNTVLKPLKRVVAGATRDLVLLTDTVGGNPEQKGADAIEAYKYALTTRDRIITKEDIKNYCRLTLQNDLKTVEVKRGMIISDIPQEGFVRTTEIEIVPRSYAEYGKTYWDKMAVSLKSQIESKAIDGVEYIVRIIDKD